MHVGTWVSAYDIDPFEVHEAERLDLLAGSQRAPARASGGRSRHATLHAVKERVHYADLAGTRTTQQRVRIESDVTAVAVDPAPGRSRPWRRPRRPPVGAGSTSPAPRHRGRRTTWDWDSELAELPDNLQEKLLAPSVEPGRYDLVIHPTNLWLTIHESIGHATELDRALGYEANYAGTSFATPDQLGTLRYGSDLMHITGDRTVEHGLVHRRRGTTRASLRRAGTSCSDGVLVGYQLDRAWRPSGLAAVQRLRLRRQRRATPRSSGCPTCRCSTRPTVPTTRAHRRGRATGIYVVGDKSWSIDMQRFNFQFTGQRFLRDPERRLAGQLKDVAYQATTTDFWGSMGPSAGQSTYVLGGAFNCGKGQPGQVAAVSHGAPVAVFAAVNVLNTAQEAGR